MMHFLVKMFGFQVTLILERRPPEASTYSRSAFLLDTSASEVSGILISVPLASRGCQT